MASFLPEHNSSYKDQEYWNTRYEQEEEFDWFKKWDDLKHVLTGCLDQKDSILMLGCGNSSLSADMYNDNYTQITNIDFSPTVIDRMSSQHADKPSMKWQVMDIKYMTFEDNSFDKAIDKGTLDALLVDQGSLWDPSEELRKEIALYIGGVYRVLKPGGKFIYITFGQPHFRRMFLDCHAWKEVKLTTLGDSFHYFLYECTK